jgi:hypothetical protein
MPQAKRSRSRRDLPPVHPAAAAIDIGATIHVAAVGPDCDKEPVRTFQTFTDDLHRLADWFARCGIKTVVMESTGVYWIPVYDILEQRGFEVLVVNARDAKHVPGRKTDVSDAQWLQRLHEYGLLRASFRPQTEMAALRAYLRQRERLLDYAAAHIQHMQKALTQMNLQLHHVVSDITGVTGMLIIRAIVRTGERAFQRFRCHWLCGALGHRLLALWSDLSGLSVAQLGQRRALVGGNMVGLAALDLVLRRLGARVMRVALVIEVVGMNPDDRAADATGFRVPPDPISHLESLRHRRFS